MAERTILELLEQQLRQVRGWTWKTIESTSEAWLYQRVDWTDNTIGWHMGHLSWELDVFTELCFDADRELDAEWDRLFGYGCEVYGASEYPPADRLMAVFHRSMRRYLEHLGQVEEDHTLTQRLPSQPGNESRDTTLLSAVTTLIFHEGEHAAGIGTLAAYFERVAGSGEGSETMVERSFAIPMSSAPTARPLPATRSPLPALPSPAASIRSRL